MTKPCTVIRHRLATGAPLGDAEAAHVEVCPDCAVLAELPARIRAARAAAADPRPGFEARLAAGARARLDRRRRRSPWLTAAAAATMLVIVAGAAWWSTRTTGDATEQRLAEHEDPTAPEQPPADDSAEDLVASLSDTEAALDFSAGGPIDEAAGQLDDLRDDIFLEDDERARVRRIADEVEKEVVRLQAEIDILNIDLRGELEAAHPDPAAVERYIDRIGALETQVRKKRILGWLRARDALAGTPAPRPSAPPAPDPDDEVYPKPLPPAPDKSALKNPFADPPPATNRAPDPDTALVDPFAEPRTGKVNIRATPWARVYLDGKEVGVTPLGMTLPAGRHEIRVERDGYQSITRTVNVDPDKLAVMSFQLAEK
jgi:hypothetical protein